MTESSTSQKLKFSEKIVSSGSERRVELNGTNGSSNKAHIPKGRMTSSSRGKIRKVRRSRPENISKSLIHEGRISQSENISKELKKEKRPLLKITFTDEEF